jgi:superfamily I DNA/RNA helicase
MTHTPTPEQQAILDAALSQSESLMINAYAGCSKTTTLELVANALPPATQGLALAFNVKIKKELEARFPSNFTVKTLNGLGHGAWSQAIGRKCELDDKKLGKLVSALLAKDAPREDWIILRNVVSAAMQQGLVLKDFPYKPLLSDTEDSWRAVFESLGYEFDERLWPKARAILEESVRLSFKGVISFDDQIYMSAMFGGVFQRYPLVMVDESQDLSPLNHIQVARSASDRIIAVGDIKQAVYAFRGADGQSMANLRKLRPAWIDLPLTTTFRCPQAVVRRAAEHAPGFTAFHTNPEGRVHYMDSVEKPKWTWQDLEQEIDGDMLAILCRNNAPLLSMAFKLIRCNVGCFMLGRDLGKGLVALSRKLVPDDDTRIAKAMVEFVSWADSQVGIALANDDENKADQIRDKFECLEAVATSQNIHTVGELREALERLFSRDTGRVLLSTGHRAKGLEWDTVLHLDPWRVPSKWAAKSAAAMEQEMNLKYVIETRPKQTLLLASLEGFQ